MMDKQKNKYYYLKGIKNGMPICLGYLAVSFTLGITARNAGMTAWQAMLTSLACNASAGQYAGFTVIAAGGTYFEMILMIFCVAVSEPGKLNPFYNYGMMTVAIPGWSLGTFLGVIMGNILPANIVSALSVGLYGMFLAIIIPPARKNKVIAALVTISMVSSYIFSRLPVISNISSGIRTIILTVVIAGVAAILFPVKEEDEHAA